MYYLAGDIGGTKTHLALFDEGKRVREKKFKSGDYPSLDAIVSEFLDEKVVRACFGIAGPIKGRRCMATNLPWVIDGSEMEKSLGIDSVVLINDLEANAYGLKVLGPDDLFTLNEGEVGEGNQALISAGTGLGQAGLYFDGKGHRPFACEGGHADFAPRSEEEIELLRFLIKKFGHVSYERILSGPGLANVYEFLGGGDQVIDSAGEKERPQLISERGLTGESDVSRRALNHFISIYGAEAGNMALRYMSLGGLFVGGGIAPKILELMKSGLFMKSFLGKGRFDRLLKGISVKVILNEETALLGASYVASEKNIS